MADGPLRVPPEEIGGIIARILARGEESVRIDVDEKGGYWARVDGVGYYDPDEIGTALWYLDAMHAIAHETRSWPTNDDPRLPFNPRFPPKG